MSKTPEGKLKDKIAEFLLTTKLRTRKLWFDKFNASAMDRAGKPDFICVFYGRPIAIEVKRPDGKGVVSGAQTITAELFTDAQGIWLFADSFELVLDTFNKIEREVVNG